MSKITEEIDKLITESGDEDFRLKQIKKIFCLTPGMQLWSQLQELNQVTSDVIKPGRYIKEKFPGTVHEKCPCDECSEERAKK